MENTKEVCLSKTSVLHRAVNKSPEMFLTTQVTCYPKQLSTTFVCLQTLLCPLHVILPSFKLYFLFGGGGGWGELNLDFSKSQSIKIIHYVIIIIIIITSTTIITMIAIITYRMFLQ